MNLSTLAVVFNVFSALTDGLMSVIIQYITEKGATWVQTFYTQFYLSTLLMVLTWMLWFGYEYHFIVKIHDDKNTKYDSYFSYLISIFPFNEDSLRISKQKWFVLFFRSICGVTSLLFYNISLSYSEAGDVLLIEFVTTMITSILFGWLFFGEKYNILVLLAVIICIGGTILVTQPSFIFGNGSTVETMNFYGFIFVFISGMIRGFSQALIKHSFKLSINWISIIVVPQLIGCIIMFIVYIFVYWVFDIKDWNLIINGINDNIDYQLLLLSTGFLYYLWYVFYTLSFRIGDIGRLGIIQNSNIIFGYIFGLLIGTSNNYICYIGVVLVLIACVVIFLELQIERDENENEDEDINTNNYNMTDKSHHKYQVINDPIEGSIEDSIDVSIDDYSKN